MTSADLRREVIPGLMHPCRLSLSRRVRFTNRFKEPVLDLWLSELPRAITRALRPVPSPDNVGGPPVEGAETRGFKPHAPTPPPARTRSGQTRRFSIPSLLVELDAADQGIRRPRRRAGPPPSAMC